MPQNVVICCDGTSNSFQKDLTNVARISEIAARIPGRQHVYYDAGVGAEEEPGFVTRLGATINRWAGSAFGVGLVRNVVEAYQEIVNEYDPRGRLFLFGFSRGAYTVRVLAGLLQNYGLLKKEHVSRSELVTRKFQNLFPKEGASDARDPEKWKAYIDKTFAEARKIKEAYCVDCPVHFMGLWDTVSSLGWAYDPKTFPNTAEMPGVSIIRHALALDERRAKFRTNRVKVPKGISQDVQEVWFSGIHCDVGGGYPEEESGLAKLCLDWMLREAGLAGLAIDPDKKTHFLEGKAKPDFMAPQHESLKGFWWALEYMRLPHRRQVNNDWVEEKIRYRGKGWRRIRRGDLVHRSVERRIVMQPVKNSNWPSSSGSLTWAD